MLCRWDDFRALVWGFGADLIGRRLAFNLSLLLSAIFTIMTGMMGNMASYCLFVLLSSFAAGGNLVLDTCVFWNIYLIKINGY